MFYFFFFIVCSKFCSGSFPGIMFIGFSIFFYSKLPMKSDLNCNNLIIAIVKILLKYWKSDINQTLFFSREHNQFKQPLDIYRVITLIIILRTFIYIHIVSFLLWRFIVGRSNSFFYFGVITMQLASFIGSNSNLSSFCEWHNDSLCGNYSLLPFIAPSVHGV